MSQSDSHSPISKSTTYLKMENVSEKTKIFGFDALSNVDQCCPEPTEFDLKELLSEINDTVERVPCDISREIIPPSASADIIFLL